MPFAVLEVRITIAIWFRINQNMLLNFLINGLMGHGVQVLVEPCLMGHGAIAVLKGAIIKLDNVDAWASC